MGRCSVREYPLSAIMFCEFVLILLPIITKGDDARHDLIALMM